MRNCIFANGNGDHVALSDVTTFTNCVSNFAGFAQSEAYAPLPIANDDERAEAKSASALNDLG